MIFCIGLAAVCLFDYTQKRIPNLLLLLLFAAALLEAAESGGIPGVLESLFRAGITAVLFFPFFRIGGIGAGDVKLLAVCAGYLPAGSVPGFCFWAMAIAAGIGFLRLLREGTLRQRFRKLRMYVRGCMLTGKVQPYHRADPETPGARIVLSGPVLGSILLYMGGVY